MEPEGPLPYHKGQSLVPVIRQINPIHIIRTCFFKIQFNISTLFTPLPQRLQFYIYVI